MNIIHMVYLIELQSYPQSLEYFLLRPHAMDENVWVGITSKPITAHNMFDAALAVKSIRGILEYTVLNVRWRIINALLFYYYNM